MRAPRLQGAGGWINTDGPLELAALRGRVVVLDFWTFACVNCLHVIDELRPLEAAYPDDVVVIGVHSPKFAHEAEHAAVVAAVARLGIRHPVLDDPELATWRQYAVKAWPTLVVDRPRGLRRRPGRRRGPGQRPRCDHRRAARRRTAAKGTLRTARPRAATPRARARPARCYFPAKALLLPAARTGRGPSIRCWWPTPAGMRSPSSAWTGATVLSPRRRRARAGAPTDRPTGASSPSRTGSTLLPTDVAAQVGYDVLVADTANHLLRGVRLADHAVRTVADLATSSCDTVTGRVPGVMSPWDVAWWPAPTAAVVAAAGRAPAADVRSARGARRRRWPAPRSRACATAPRSTGGWPSRPGSPPTVTGCGSSTPRPPRCAGSICDGRLHTAVGEGLFDFGHVDGPAAQARLQHPLGVAVLPDGAVAIADTFNGAVRRYDPRHRPGDHAGRRRWPSPAGSCWSTTPGRGRIGRLTG